jgi:hypothetical protein
MTRYIWVKAHTRRRPRKRTAAEIAAKKLRQKRESEGFAATDAAGKHHRAGEAGL